MKHRTVLAFVLTAIALGVPCAAWYVVGLRETERRVREIEGSPLQLANDTAAQLAERLHDRLETLRTVESRRPYYHYQNLYHDPKGASEGASVVPSPLAEGPTDPLVLGYFQIDAAGKLTMPTVGDDSNAVSTALLKQLEPVVPSSTCVMAMRQDSTPQQVQILQPEAYAQNVQAGQIYKNILSKTANSFTNAPQGRVAISVGPFQWCSVPISNVRTPVALREVHTPEGRLVQGFIVSLQAIAESFKGAALPAEFVPPDSEDEVAATVDGLFWKVTVNIAGALDAARTQARETRRHFRKMFAFGATAAGVAGLCVVWLVWQTERLARQRSQFAASAAHELRTPLAGLRLYSDMLADGLGDPGKTRDYAQKISSESERLGRVVGNVLGFTRLERGTLKVRLETGDLAACVRECLSRYPNVKFESETVPAVGFDRDAVAQILQNLLDNAQKYANGRVEVSLASHDGAVALRVRDRGAGLPGEVRRHLFEAFRRGPDNDAPAGLGLGLVLVKALAEAQGARVRYADAAGGGAEFTVNFYPPLT